MNNSISLKNKFRLAIKKSIVVFLVICMAGNTFCAVSANDGSAYITKSEFDALVNTFNEEMDLIENSIQSKVDGAILNYLNSISDTKKDKTEVGYFKALPSTATTVTMQPYNAFSYVGGNPDVYIKGTFSSIYGSAGNLGSSYYGYCNYTGSTNGARRFVEYTGGLYRWVGYTTNYKETHDITWTYTGNSDTGFDLGSGSLYMYVFGTSSLSTTSPTTSPSWSSYMKWRFGDSDTRWGIFSARTCAIDTTFNNYTVGNKYDLIYSDYSSASANNMRCFIEGNPYNRYFAGASISYATVMSSGSRWFYYTLIRCSDGRRRSGSSTNWYGYNPGYYSTAVFVAGFEPGVTRWSQVLNADKTTYSYKDSQGQNRTLSNYNMINGAVLCPVVKGGRYTWPVEFSSTSDTTLWIKYDKFDGAPVTADCIPVSVDGGPSYRSATIKDGKGTITFTAEVDGLLFFKWSSGKSIKVNESKNISYEYEEE